MREEPEAYFQAAKGEFVTTKIAGAIVACLVMLMSVASGALEPGATREKVWRQYLSPAEQAALAEMTAAAATNEAGLSEAGSETMLKTMRDSFAQFVSLAAPPPAGVNIRQFEEKGLKGLWFEPKSAAGDRVLLYFHGGGYVAGSPLTGAAVAGYLAQRAGVISFSLDYPLAPESPYPAAVDNALAAYQMLLDQGIKAGNIVLAGDSAGGGLTLTTLLTIRDKGLSQPAGAILLSPWADLSHSQPSITIKKDDDLYLNLGFLETLASMYVGGKDLKTPLISPVYADLRGLPPLLIQVGSHEILLDDALTIARNAALADVPVTLTVWPGYSHVFQMPYAKLEGARKALDDGAGFISAAIERTLLSPKADPAK